MKLLVIGLDGVSRDTLERGWTPRLEALSRAGDHLELYEDLFSRGWSEIMLGEHADRTGALYERPLMDGSHGWTEAFRLSDVPGLGQQIRPFWQAAAEKGLRVGVMNVPTTFPAPAVDGFFVSGGGGGGPITEKPTAEMVHPKSILPRLHASGYIVDRRLPTLLADPDGMNPARIVELLTEMVDRRVESFRDLCIDDPVDIGFLVIKSATVAIESLVLPELRKAELSDDTANEDLIAAARTLYGALDDALADCIDRLGADRVLIVSDHSTVVRRAWVNPNAFLIETGYQKKATARRGLFDLIRNARHLVPVTLRTRIKRNKAIRRSYESMTTFDPGTSRAFCMAHSNGAHGIYVNDRARFGGPVEPGEIDAVADGIVADFAAHPETAAHGLRARRKSCAADTAACRQFPDIVLDLPDGYQTSIRRADFVSLLDLPAQKLTMHDLARDMRLTGKGHAPLALSIGASWAEPGGHDVDLTAVHREMLRCMEN